MRNCDTATEPPGLFDTREPEGSYELDLSLPYERMVVMEVRTVGGG